MNIKMLSGAELRKMKLKSLVPSSFNRSLDMIRVKRIIDNFDERAAMPIMISVRDGKNNIFNGQHTSEALKGKGYTEWDCIVYRGLTLAEEAELYLIFNTAQKPLNGTDKFFGAWTANRHGASEIHKIAKQYEFTIARVDDVAKPYFQNPWELIKCLKKFRKTTSQDDVSLLHRFMKFLKIWKNQEASLSNPFLRALCDFVIITRSISEDNLLGFFKNSSAGIIAREALNNQSLDKDARSPEKHIKWVLFSFIPDNVLNITGLMRYMSFNIRTKIRKAA